MAPHYAVQTIAGEYPIENLRPGASSLGSTYIHRPTDHAPYLLVCSPPRAHAADEWLRANGWTPLPHIYDTGTPVGDEAHTGLIHHGPDVTPGDNTVSAMKKVAEATGMKCFHPFR